MKYITTPNVYRTNINASVIALLTAQHRVSADLRSCYILYNTDIKTC